MQHIHWLLSFAFTQLCFGRLHELHLLSERLVCTSHCQASRRLV